MNISTFLYTLFFGAIVGKDEFGNRYYTNKKGRRWVAYKGIAEASKVPADWHRWLHKTTDTLPESSKKKYKWEKAHLPNLSGTDLAYLPPRHIKRGEKSPRVVGEYEAWAPKE